MSYEIVVIKGDGIGPEVVEAALHVLIETGIKFSYIEDEVGYEIFKKEGTSLKRETIDLIRGSDACLFGATKTPFDVTNYKSPIIMLRKELDLYANIRPIRSWPGIYSLKKDIDFVIVRENTEGAYCGIGGVFASTAFNMRIITETGSERIVRYALELAKKQGRKKVTVVHKANVLRETCGLFRRVAYNIAAEYPEIEFEEILIDAMVMYLVQRPKDFDIIVTTNLFGDIISDEAAGIVGGLGLAPSASIGEKVALFEPVHGSAPDIAGKNIANPIAEILSAKMMLEYFGENEKAKKIEDAITNVLKKGTFRTPDLGGNSTTDDVTNAIIEEIVK